MNEHLYTGECVISSCVPTNRVAMFRTYIKHAKIWDVSSLHTNAV
jgi:hypothetical protein